MAPDQLDRLQNGDGGQFTCFSVYLDHQRRAFHLGDVESRNREWPWHFLPWILCGGENQELMAANCLQCAEQSAVEYKQLLHAVSERPH